MSQSLLDLAYKLTQAGEPFVIATVVWCERPASAKPGSQAIIQKNGELVGWVGGSCVQPVVTREALRLLRDGGDAYLLRLGAPESGIVRRDVRVFPMTCSSGSVVDVYMEPHLPQTHLLLVGESPVIAALQQLAPTIDFRVTQLTHANLNEVEINAHTYILIASHGQYDEEALEQALHSSAAYIGMVASRRRADICRDYLRASNMKEEQIARLKAPAGFDIGAITPEEIAVTILAELLQVRRHAPVNSQHALVSDKQASTVDEQPVDSTASTAVDPICGMLVEVATARHRTSYEGRDFYFCCPACKRQFERDPAQYAL
ncbi:MAG: XdhC family protein [Ktedonobacteraceae bacterium]|nr:XdhC family protein [Ktedonobacteraceae bacterium]